ncbi:hypothetical protein GCM10010123_05820 [Pilimelia anulata]|uniref:Uncharacterized protein n=1 Tax=Pilimelia anulata TaxID=53371 RepID=A0A8J3B735_9ACTN|nr:hypothetical protein GCM10010123_05820 [Pilimelia anulata]
MRRGAALVLVAALLAGCGGARPDTRFSPPTARPDAGEAPERVVASLTADLSADGPYRAPTAAESRRAAAAFGGLLAGARAPGGLADLGYVAGAHTDPATGRRYALLRPPAGDRRGWPSVLAYADAPPTVLVEAPHPRADLGSEVIAARLAAAAPRAMLLVAGAHRDAAGGRADVAHERGSLFHTLAARAAAARLPQVQVHGYADASLPGVDAVVSTGATVVAVTDPAPRVVAALAGTGLRVCAAWQRRCGDLEGRTNEQGRAARAAGAAFVHLELSRSVRENPARLDRVITALAPILADLRPPA